MLHTWSYNMGLASGTVARLSNLPRPNELKDIPAIEKILDMSELMQEIFLPSSYVEGYVTAYDHPDWKFIG